MVLPSSMRLKGHRCFSYLHRFGEKYYSSSFVLKVAKAKPNLLKRSLNQNIQSTFHLRFAVAISNKVSKKAVIRNRFRRILHHHLKTRLEKSQDLSNAWALFSVKPNTCISDPYPLLEECDRLLKSANLLS
tara:strand:- start:1213 stop:1605 length:393 start_codon:yes stop_codon:yes gene_type:complete